MKPPAGLRPAPRAEDAVPGLGDAGVLADNVPQRSPPQLAELLGGKRSRLLPANLNLKIDLKCSLSSDCIFHTLAFSNSPSLSLSCMEFCLSFTFTFTFLHGTLSQFLNEIDKRLN